MAISRPRQTAGFEFDRCIGGGQPPLQIPFLMTANTAFSIGDLVYLDVGTGKIAKYTASANAALWGIMAEAVTTTDNTATAEWYAKVNVDRRSIYRVSIGTGATLFLDAAGNATATTTTFTTTNATLVTASTDLIGSLIYFYSGTGKGEKRTISGYSIAGGIATMTFLKALSASPDTTSNIVCGGVAGKDGTWAEGTIGLAVGNHQYVDFTVLPQEGRTPLRVVGIDWKNLIAFVQLDAPYTPQMILGDNKLLGFGDLATTLGGDLAMRWDGTDFDVLPAVDDTVIKIGNGTLSCDFWLYGNAAADNIILDASGNIVNFDGIDLQLEDSDFLYFGDAKDLSMKWDATNFEVLPVADDTGSFNLGDGTTDMDFKVFLGAAADYFLCDVGNSRVDVVGVDLRYDETCLHASVKNQTKSANYTMARKDSGTFTYVDTSATITLPATVVGYHYTFINSGADAAVQLSVKPNASDSISGAQLANTSADGRALTNTLATAKKGDLLSIVADGSSGWYVTQLHGTWA